MAMGPTVRDKNASHEFVMQDGEASKSNEAPPGTLAAHLVNNISNAQRPSKHSEHNEQEDLEQLLLEVSKLGDSINDETNTASKIHYHHKLIYVVVKCVFGNLTKENPFSKERDLKQASDGFAVLIVTIKDTPSVLLHVAGAGAKLKDGVNVPLWIWLFPRILVLLGNSFCEPLHKKISEFFRTVFEAFSNPLQLWNLTPSMFRYLQHCAEATLNRLQDPDLVAQESPILGLMLPLASIEDSITILGTPDLYVEGCMYAIDGLQDALSHLNHLLSLLVEFSTTSSGSYDPNPSSRDYMAWLLDSIAELFQLELTWKPGSVVHLTSKTVPVSIQTVFKLLSSTQYKLSEPTLRKGYRMLANLVAKVNSLTEISDTKDKILLCKVLLNIASICADHEVVRQVVSGKLLPVLSNLVGSAAKNDDLQRCVQVLAQHSKDISDPVNSAIDNVASFDDAGITAYFHHLRIANSNGLEQVNEPPHKRRRISFVNELFEEVSNKVNSLLNAPQAVEIVGISKFAAQSFPQLNSSNRSRALKYLGQLSCASSNTLSVVRDETGAILEAGCTICDSQPGTMKLSARSNIGSELVLALQELVPLPEFEQSRKPRVFALLAIRSLVMHAKLGIDDFLDLEMSLLGQWCFRSLNSSIRELRVAAGRTIPAFFREHLEANLIARNKAWALDTLRVLSEKSPVHLLETNILAWGQIGRVCKDTELNLVLHRLVEYLGHTNQVISSAAFNEILNIAECLGIPVGQMFNPFWRNLAHTAVKDLQSRPQTAQLMAELLSVTVSELLIMTQVYTLPWLVLTKKRDVILRITQARNEDDPWRTCLESANLRAILALLLVQNVRDLETFIMDLFNQVSPHFKEKSLDLVDLFKIEPIGIALELLKNAGEEDEAKKSRFRKALQFLASRSHHAGSNRSKKSNHVGPFLEQHTLGIMSDFSDLLNDMRGWQSVSEKRRALNGIDEMLRVGKSYIRSALPQICACLQSALGNDEIRTTAFTAWTTMILNLDDEDVGNMLENTFSIIILHWKVFDEPSRLSAKELIKYLLEKRHEMINQFIDVIPSLEQVPDLADFENSLKSMRVNLSVHYNFKTFSQRICHEHASVVIQALTELAKYLRKNQAFLQASAVSEQPDIVVGELLRNILDACIKFNGSNIDVARLCAECIGLVGCLDSNRVEAVREQREFVMVSNFWDAEDSTNFVLFLLEEVLVKAFLSATNPKAQGFLSYAMQELLEKCDFKRVCGRFLTRPVSSFEEDGTVEHWNKWLSLPETVRATLTPFLKSKYVLTEMVKAGTNYPIFQPDKKFSVWLRSFVLDLLERPQNQFALLIFAPLCRVIRIQDTSVASFMLPYVVLHTVALGSNDEREQITQELLRVLSHEATEGSHNEQTNVKLCSEAVFRILDYLSRWTQDFKASQVNGQMSGRELRWQDGAQQPNIDESIRRVNSVLSAIPAEVISRRAVECKSYARALFHWEQYIRQVRENSSKVPDDSVRLERLQEIYTQIDEPDGIEGISEHLQVLDIDQQILAHRKAGRWTAVQKWYEIQLAETPDDVDLQVNLLYCLKESGQHDVLLNYVEGMHQSNSGVSRLLPFATEASWATGRWETLEKYLSLAPSEIGGDFNVSVGRSLLALQRKDIESFSGTIKALREHIAGSLSADTTSSLGVCHDTMLKFHVLTELEMIAGSQSVMSPPRQEVLQSLERRLEAIGAYLNDKQYLLGIRRAAMLLSSPTFTKADVASAWLTSARLARKGNSIHQSFNAVLHASQLGDAAATIEHARLMWKEGNSRKAIQCLQGAIASNEFMSYNIGPADDSLEHTDQSLAEHQNLLTARAHLLLAKWLDSAGQTHSTALRSQYQLAVKLHQHWEKAHYYLGRHYNKLLESEKALPSEHQSQAYLTGENAKLVIENYLRSLSYGTKYIYQTLPRVLTLWLDLGTQVMQPVDSRYGTKEYTTKLATHRKDQLKNLHNRFTKYIQKMPAYIFYTALPQIVARITHNNPDVYKHLQQIIIKVVSAYPQQALWSLLAVSTSTQVERKHRGSIILASLRAGPKKSDTGSLDMRMMIKSGEKLTDQLLKVCNAGTFQGNRTIIASITKDLGFSTKLCTPSPLAVPIESVLTATLPTLTDNIRAHKAFSQDIVTISSFMDEVLVLSSLQKPRKLTARGSDGRKYGLLCKPKDDLRKDQRLMEFNSMINRSLKRDAESSKRQLYIKTYAVTPLNEECGIIEWVDGLKTLRDILLNLYKGRGISPNYSDLKIWLDKACEAEDKLPYFTEKVLSGFPPVFHSWFVQQFPEPSAWFVARLKYTRSAAVMSMVGTILGLGDRHGENILFEEGNGGTFHVDFNCLFDKGLTFLQPERVPFRLTHNMVDAMGVYGYEGPFRKSSELTLKLLRQNEETLMTILEAFVYDPTLDLLAKKKEKKREREAGIPDTPQGVLDSIRRKVRGLLAGESVPLGVEGQVDELIKQAVSSKNLAAMYIGWCAFF